MVEKHPSLDAVDSDDHLEAKNQDFQTACRIWFCPTDERIARELRELPQQEREKVWADLSGNEKTSQFRNDIVEDPCEISSAIDAMTDEIKATAQGEDAVSVATKQSPSYLNNRSYQLMFLRSCEYDGKRAAQKLMEHMETKRALFGDEVLSRDVMQSDLSPDDMDVLQSGWVQVLPERDVAGRLVLFFSYDSLRYKERANASRALFYLMTAALRDENVQKFGAVIIWSHMTPFSGGFDYEVNRMATQTAAAIPLRPVARYVVYQFSLWDQVIEVLNHFVSPQLRSRTRNIHGSHSKVMRSLACLGVPIRSIPFCGDNSTTFDNMNKWIMEHKYRESSHKRTSEETLPATSLPTKRRRLLYV